MTSRLIGARSCLAASRCPRSPRCVPRRRDRCARRLPTSGPRRSGSRARSSISSTARSATARRGTAKATPPRICAPGPATSRRASSRSARLPTERSRPIRTSSTSSGAACPTPRCPPGPTSPTRKCRISPTSLRPSPPTSPTPRMLPKPVPLPSAPSATNESIELGKKLYEETGCVKCHGTLGRGDGPSAPTLKDDWGHPIRAGEPRAELDLPGRVVPRGHLQDDEHGVQRHAHAVVPRRPHARATMGDHRLHRLSLGQQRAWLYQPRRRQARPGADRSGEGGRELRLRSCGPLSDRRADHGAGTRVPSARDQRHRSGDLRCRLHRPPRSMARHERAEDGEERAVASRAAGGGGGASGWRRGAGAGSKGGVFGDAEVAPAPAGQAQDPFAEAEPRQATSHPSSPTRSRSRFLRRCRRAPASPTSSSVTPRTRWISGSSIWPAPIPFSSPAREARTSLPSDTGDLTGVASYDQGEWSVIFKRPLRPASGAPFSPGEFMPVAFSVWDGFSRERGNRRGLTLWYSLYVEPEVVPSAVGPMVRTALIILAIELAVIGWVRSASRRSRPRELGGEPRQPAATSA